MEKRKIMGIVFIVLAVWGFLNMIMIYIKETNQCQTLSESCSDYPYGIKLFINLGALGYGIYLIAKDKKKLNS